MSSYSPGIPTSFDPAIHLHSEIDFPQDAPTSPSHSEDIEALHILAAEDKLNKTNQRVVIQHRAWNITEVFRSEEDYSIGTSYRCCSGWKHRD
jgi:chromosome transmission fidelity protein 18